MSKLADLVALLADRVLSDELAQLQAEHDYLMARAPFSAGERVVLVEVIDFAKTPGWQHCKEILQPGATGTVNSITFSRYMPGWLVYYKPEVTWTVHDRGSGPIRRYRCDLSTGDDHTFMFAAESLRAATEHDSPLMRPADAECWRFGCSNCASAL